MQLAPVCAPALRFHFPASSPQLPSSLPALPICCCTVPLPGSSRRRREGGTLLPPSAALPPCALVPAYSAYSSPCCSKQSSSPRDVVATTPLPLVRPLPVNSNSGPEARCRCVRCSPQESPVSHTVRSRGGRCLPAASGAVVHEMSGHHASRCRKSESPPPRHAPSAACPHSGGLAAVTAGGCGGMAGEAGQEAQQLGGQAAARMPRRAAHLHRARRAPSGWWSSWGRRGARC